MDFSNVTIVDALNIYNQIEQENEMKQKIDRLISKISNPSTRKHIIEHLGHIGLYATTDQMKIITEKLLKYPDTKELVEKGIWKHLINHAQEGAELYEILGKNAVIKKEMFEHVNWLIRYTGTQKMDNVPDISEALLKLEDGPILVAQNIDQFLAYGYINLGTIMSSCIQDRKASPLIRERFDELFGLCNISEFADVIDAMRDNPLFEKEYKKYHFFAELYNTAKRGIDEKNKEFANDSKWIYNPNLINTGGNIIDPRLTRSLNEIFSELLNLPDNDLKEIEEKFQSYSGENPVSFKSIGSTSAVFEAGDEILKFSKTPIKYQVPLHPRTMVPKYRKQYQNKFSLLVLDKGDDSKDLVTDELVLQIFQEYERAGIFWADARKENIVKLLKDNPTVQVPEDIGFYRINEQLENLDPSEPTLKVGDFVVCDLDFFYRLDDPEIKIGNLAPNVIAYIKQSGKYKFLEDKLFLPLHNAINFDPYNKRNSRFITSITFS